MMLRFFFLLCFLGSTILGNTQSALPLSFIQGLEAAQIDYFEPVERQFRRLRNTQNSFFSYHHALRKRKSRLEIRYAIIPSGQSPLADLPHLKCLTTATHLAINDDNSTLAVHNIPADQLQEQYQADWGGIVYFQPKAAFSTRQHCKLVALYAEEKGMALIFFLFDDPSEDLENDWANLRFRQ